ncbi:MAG: AAA family ATPase [Planctomycetota bacterium]
MAREADGYSGDFQRSLDRLKSDRHAILDEIAKVIVGQESVLRLLLAAIMARGHCLLMGVPGLAKTAMVKALGQTLDLKFKRIQFTPDLMPSDITGTNVISEDDRGRRDFRFVQGPVFANIVLADEINRTPPKTQASLLEAMQESQVTVGQETYRLPTPFFVIATQNPIEQEGTYELPEAQLDRFMFLAQVDYPSLSEEEKILVRTTRARTHKPQKVLSVTGIVNIQQLVRQVAISNYVVSYVARLSRSSRPKDDMAPRFVRELVEWGAGPRAGQYLIWGAKALAAMDGRASVSIRDVREVAVPVLRHRIAVNFQGQAEGIDSVEIVKRLLKVVPKPAVARDA